MREFHRRWRRYLTIAAVALVYFAVGKLGLNLFGVLHPSATAVWLPTGVAIAVLLLFGYALWPAIFVGAFLVNVTTAGSALTSVGIAVGNTLEALLAAYLVNRFAGGRRAFKRAPDVLKFAGLASLASPTVSATVGAAVLAFAGYLPLEQLRAVWFTWWLGDASGAMVVAPLIVLWYDDHVLGFSPSRVAEAVLMFAAVIASGAIIFLNPILAGYPLSFLCIPSLIWAAFRFGQREVATAAALMSAIAIAGTAAGRGPFMMPAENESLLLLQGFMTLMVMTALPLAALSTERAGLLARERAARAAAEAANRAKDEFLAVLSHELRNPLSAIGAASEVLDRLRDPAAADVYRWRALIQRQTRHLSRLIDDLLDIARATADKMRLELMPVEIGETAERCVRTLAAAADPDAPRIELLLREAWIVADPDRIEQIINNLLNNAIKHTPADGRVVVEAFSEGNTAVLRVQDTGSGIRSDLLPYVFEPFVQDQQGLERAAGGLGIGLTLVRRLTELHGGRVEACSDGPQRGSTFTVQFPRIEAPAPVRLELGDRARKAGPRRRILLVEDNADTRKSLRALLELGGYETHEAADGESGLAEALRLRPDLVLLDIGLPGLDGYEVARRLKAAVPDTPLVALTGYGQAADKMNAQQAGFDVHLLKPVSVERLYEVIGRLLEPKLQVLPVSS